jgi:hypothetical protein
VVVRRITGLDGAAGDGFIDQEQHLFARAVREVVCAWRFPVGVDGLVINNAIEKGNRRKWSDDSPFVYWNRKSD